MVDMGEWPEVFEFKNDKIDRGPDRDWMCREGMCPIHRIERYTRKLLPVSSSEMLENYRNHLVAIKKKLKRRNQLTKNKVTILEFQKKRLEEKYLRLLEKVGIVVLLP